MLLGSSDEPLPRQSSQVQAAEDILDKYRNIKRTSPSDGATGGASYDGTGGQNFYIKLLHTLMYMHWVIYLYFLILADLCVEDGVPESQREDTLQHISTDDLPDSASQTAHQHDSKFSFRSEIYNPVAKRLLHTIIQQPLVLMLLVFFVLFCFFFQWCQEEIEVGTVLCWFGGITYHGSCYHTKWVTRSHGLWR